jgi:hypothetical protein
MLITGIILFHTLYIITIIPDKEMVYTYLRKLRTCIRRQFIIQASNSFDSLPKAIKHISRIHNKFKISLKHSLHTHPFYSSD